MYCCVLVCTVVYVCMSVCLLQHRARAALSTHNWKPERAMEHLISWNLPSPIDLIHSTVHRVSWTVASSVLHNVQQIQVYCHCSWQAALYTVFHKKTTLYLIAHTSAMLTDFQNFFTLVLSSDCVMNWSLRIPLHLKCVATLPCETLMFKSWFKVR